MTPRTRIAVAATLAGAFLAGRLSFAEEAAEKTVAAKRYRIVWAESGCDLVHGGGQWIQELFLPEANVVAGLLYEWPSSGEPGPGAASQDPRRPRLYARASDRPRNDLTGLGEAKPSDVEDVRIPADLAQRIADLAALTRRLDEEGLRAGAEVAKRLGMKRIE